jgi:hypothetical protein
MTPSGDGNRRKDQIFGFVQVSCLINSATRNTLGIDQAIQVETMGEHLNRRCNCYRRSAIERLIAI